MRHRRCWLATVLALLLVVPLQAQPDDAKAPDGLTLYQLPLSRGFAATNETELLAPIAALHLAGLAGEVILARLGVTPPSAARDLAASVSFPGSEPKWAERVCFVPELPGATEPTLTGWLALSLPAEVEPGTYQGTLTVRCTDREAQLPLTLTVTAGRLGPADAQYLLLSPSPAPIDSEKAPLPPGLPSLWAGASEVSFLSLAEQNGDVGLDLSALNAAADRVTPPFGTEQPLPVFLGPLLNRLCRQFAVEPRGATYVLVYHSILTQLRDWAKGKGLALIFVPPAGEDASTPDPRSLEQDLLILRETPEVAVLLPADPVLSFSRPDQQRLLNLAQASLARTREGVLLAAKPKGQSLPLWLQVAEGDRLRAGYWAETVGATVVLVAAEGRPEDRLWTLASQTDARYLATLKALLARAEGSKDPAVKQPFRSAQADVDRLTRELDQATRERTDQALGDAELDRWRDTLRQHIARLSELLP